MWGDVGGGGCALLLAHERAGGASRGTGWGWGGWRRDWHGQALAGLSVAPGRVAWGVWGVVPCGVVLAVVGVRCLAHERAGARSRGEG